MSARSRLIREGPEPVHRTGLTFRQAGKRQRLFRLVSRVTEDLAGVPMGRSTTARRVYLTYRVQYALEPWRFFTIIAQPGDNPTDFVFGRRKAWLSLGPGTGAGRAVGSKKQ